MSSGAGILAQKPSQPDETSASKAFTQLPPDIAKAVAAFKSKGHKWTPDYKPGSEDEKIRAVFAAYATNDEPDNRDESQDPWKFEVCHGLEDVYRKCRLILSRFSGRKRSFQAEP
jgi:hypothetical protein